MGDIFDVGNGFVIVVMFDYEEFFWDDLMGEVVEVCMIFFVKNYSWVNDDELILIGWFFLVVKYFFCLNFGVIVVVEGIGWCFFI